MLKSKVMQKRDFQPFGTVSALTLGGGGLGQVWGETTREEAVKTVNLAIEKALPTSMLHQCMEKERLRKLLVRFLKEKI